MRYLTDIRRLFTASLFTLIACAVLLCAAPHAAHALTEEEALEVTSKGWHTLSTGHHVYMTTRSTPATGFQKIGGRYYYFDEEGYLGLGWITVGKYKYDGQTAGALGKKLGMLKSGYVKVGGSYCLFSTKKKLGKHGRLMTGWQKIDSDVFYFQEDGTKLSGLQEVGGKLYFFQKSGKAKLKGRVKTGWKKTGGNKYYCRPTGKVGKLYGAAVRNKTIKISGISYTFDENGILQKSAGTTAYTKFINKIGKMAHKDMEETGILASVTVAQACVESAFGTSQLATHARNLFGMKAALSTSWKSSWSGKTYSKKTLEYINGRYITITASFRKYASYAESIADHSAYLAGAKLSNGSYRYAGIVGCKKPKKAAQIIKNGGYATAPNYVSALMNVIDKYDLTQFD